MCVAGTDWFTGKGLDGRQRAVYAVNNWDAPIYQLILGLLTAIGLSDFFF